MEVTEFLSTVEAATTTIRNSVNALSKEEKRCLLRDLSQHNVAADGAYRHIGNQILHLANEEDRFLN